MRWWSWPCTHSHLLALNHSTHQVRDVYPVVQIAEPKQKAETHTIRQHTHTTRVDTLVVEEVVGLDRALGFLHKFHTRANVGVVLVAPSHLFITSNKHAISKHDESTSAHTLFWCAAKCALTKQMVESKI